MNYIKGQRTISASGFTLIEVMVGIAIFAVLSALIVGSIQGNSDRNAKLEAQRFIAVVNEVRDEAVISGKILLMSVDEKGLSYGFDVVGGAQNSNQGDTLLRTRFLDESVKLKWEVFDDFIDEDDETFLELSNKNDNSDNDNSNSADQDVTSSERVIISPLGDITPFQVRFGGEDDEFVVELNDDSILSMTIKRSNFF